jgi:hypothetical protein
MADGTGYEKARMADDATQASIDSRMAELNSLFGQFNPSYRAVNLKKPELGKFTVDPAEIRQDQALPGESRYYYSQMKKKKEIV